MIVRNFPLWAVLVMNLAVIAVLAAFAYFMKWMGVQFALGWIFGFAFCYVMFRCWRFDYDEPTVPIKQSPQPPQRR